MDRECRKAFNKIKEYLSDPLVVVPPEHGKPLLLYLSVLDSAFGCMFGQHDETGRKEQAIYYLSKKFTPYIEALHVRIHHAFNIPARPAQVYLSEVDVYRKTGQWQILLSEFNILDITQKAIKGQALADHLAENPMDKNYEPLTTYFPEEEVLFTGDDIAESYLDLRMFIDRAPNFKGVGIGALLVSESGQHYMRLARIRFPCTNNMVEYEACILGIRMTVDMYIKELLAIGDSDL
ncbi:PREDICTED: uncharacterized protein LOC109230210 [Nicotiana attenuata]|uniref:uncharacterized protein LOC109230210 n=1 Tax=Nicotiana attenuata TaxID=49451 RepID=UPI0009059AF5|nr:PREDICTED: uncharacterized protein LOC109230210 [Nicotiana attenuata]